MNPLSPIVEEALVEFDEMSDALFRCVVADIRPLGITRTTYRAALLDGTLSAGQFVMNLFCLRFLLELGVIDPPDADADELDLDLFAMDARRAMDEVHRREAARSGEPT